jgi:hypothetical protein
MVPPEESISDASHTGEFKTKAGNWLFLQGTSTVLLVAIFSVNVWLAVKGVPQMWDRHEMAVKAARAEFAEVNKSQRTDLLEQLKAERDDFMRALDRIADGK